MHLEHEKSKNTADLLNMDQYKVERLPSRPLSQCDVWKRRVGAPLAIFAFVYIGYFLELPYLQNIDPKLLTKTALVRFNEIGADNFSRSNVFMLAIFAASLILLVTETIQNYLRSERRSVGK